MRLGSVLIFALLVVGCGSSTSDVETSNASASTTDDSKPRVALVMKSLANEFFSTMADGATNHQADHASEYDLIVNGIKDETDVTRQVELVNEMVAAGVNAIVIAPADSKALVPALRKAKQKSVVVVNIDNRLDADVLAAEDVTIPFVGPDNRAGAKTVGDYLASQLAADATVAILEGVTTSFNAQQRKAGFEDAMTAAGIDVVASQSAKWETSLANSIAASILSEHPNVDAILAANDSMALGAIAAVKDAGKADAVQIVGFDNISAVQQAIRDGKIIATADQHGDQLAVFGIEHALKLIANPDAELADIETPVDLVTAETLASSSVGASE